MISRREFLQRASGAVLSAGLGVPILTWGAEPGVVISGKDGMMVRSQRFLDLETPVEFLGSFLTPVSHFFVRNHMHEPAVLTAAEWRLRVGGEVEKPLTLSLSDLRRLSAHSVVNTLECAGNGRGLCQPQVPGVQWQKGAVGTARYSGVRLSDILNRAGLKASGKHVMFRGQDEVPGKVPPFIRSIPVEKALDSDTLIATHMNAAPLTTHHGFPARVLVPGWIGAASCKWLTEVKVLDKPFDGNFMNPGYRMPNQPVKPGETVKPEDTHSLTALTVKSLITSPESGVVGRRTQIQGVAWAGEAEVVKVEVSTDSGTTWTTARFGKDQSKYAWRLWSLAWTPSRAGDFVILSRATDSQGRVQPAAAVWNPSGYLNNAIDQVKINVKA
jgi:DMSO/TMAO reductase YedYZ molybdopterin-dependent catalytic subunit